MTIRERLNPGQSEQTLKEEMQKAGFVVYLVTDVFNKKERSNLLRLSKPYLEELILNGRRYPGKQTKNLVNNGSFRLYNERLETGFKKASGLNFNANKSWINLTTGKKEDLNWHNHPVPWSGVYYLKTPFYSKGTLFQSQRGGEIKINAPENSLLVFPGGFYHSAPVSPVPFLRFRRYTMAIDFV